MTVNITSNTSIDISTLAVNVDNLTLIGGNAINGTGNSLSNLIIGNSANNVLDGGTAGNDTLAGGKGNDTYVFSKSSITVKEKAGEGTDLVIINYSGGYFLEDEVENATLTIGPSWLVGNSKNNLLSGNSLDNWLNGGLTGIDTLIGGMGNDLYWVYSTTVTIIENAGEGTDTVTTNLNYTMGVNLENLIFDGSSNINGCGNSLTNIITGNSKNNIINGGTAGSDTLIGGLGNDTYIVSHTGMTVTENTGEGTDLVKSSINYTMGANIENLILTGSANIGKGNSLSNYIKGNSISSTLSGGLLGNDTLIGGIGADSIGISYSTGNNYIDCGAGNDHVMSDCNRGNNTIIGNNGADGFYISYNTGNNYVNSGTDDDYIVFIDCTGNQTIIGGNGNETIIIDTNNGNNIINGESGNEEIYINGGTGNNTIVGGIGDDLIKSYAFIGNNILNGDSGNDKLTIYVNSGNNLLNGGEGNDTITVWKNTGSNTLIGGLGNDKYIVYETNVTIIEIAGQGTDTVQTSISNTLASNVENLILTISAVTGVGNSLANVITGNSANNIINAGTAGKDTLIGSTGDDTYIIDHTGVIIKELLNEGTDLVQSSVSYTLSNNIENLALGGTAAINGTGNSLANKIDGDSYANILDGGTAGSDTLTGDLGSDTYIINRTNVTVVEISAPGSDLVKSSISYTLSNNIHIENLTLTGISNINGIGNSLTNIITGNSKNNILDGGTVGADTLVGAKGNDTYLIDRTNITISENTNEGKDLLISSISYTLSSSCEVENLTLIGSAVSGQGNSLGNIITGNTLDNLLGGSLAASKTDTLIGGLGNDTYTFMLHTDVVIEKAGEGIDTVSSKVSYSLAANLENLIFIASASPSFGTGNTLDNLIQGNNNKNILNGGTKGADTLAGSTGNDTYIIYHTGVTVVEISGEGTELIQASINYTLSNFIDIEDLTLTGSSNINAVGNTLTNIITGNSKNNILDGGTAGADTLVGAKGNDTYLINRTNITISENLKEGADVVVSSINYTMGANLENLILTGGANIAKGNSLSNYIVANSINSTLSGGLLGNDTFIGGIGTDSISISYSSGNNVIYSGDGDDKISAYYSTGNNIIYAGDGQNYIYFNNNSGNNHIYGEKGSNYFVFDSNTGNNIIHGGAVKDVTPNRIWYDYGIGNNTFYGGDPEAWIMLNSDKGNNKIYGTSGDNYLTEQYCTGNNIIYGYAGDDRIILTENEGNNTLVGGLGNDTYEIYNDTSAKIIELAGQGTDIVKSSVSYTLAANVENLTFTGTSAINGYGNVITNVITGNTANNIISSGGGGKDTLVGGNGNDTYIITNTGVTITELTGEGTDLVQSSVNFTLGAFVDNLTLTGSSAVYGYGNSLTNTITGNSKNNVINGGIAGLDTLIGGIGNDTYLLNIQSVQLIEAASEGTDIVFSTVKYTLGNNIENLILTGSANIGKGNSLSNYIKGNSISSTLSGGLLGNDTFIGGIGTDSINICNSSGNNYIYGGDGEEDIILWYSSTNNTIYGGNDHDYVDFHYSIGNNKVFCDADSDAIDCWFSTGNNLFDLGSGDDYIYDWYGSGNDYIYGKDGNDLISFNWNYKNTTIYGGNGNDNIALQENVGNNIIYGETGNDILRISRNTGNNTLIGGLGNDTYEIDDPTAMIVELATQGTDIVRSSVSYTLANNIENLTLTGNSAINGFGNAITNVITGNTAINILDGGTAGKDTLIGGVSNDTYIVSHTGIIIKENASEGTDLVQSSVSYTLSNDIETLTLTGSTAIKGKGNSLTNLITGNSLANVLDGGTAGSDTIIGGLGNDTYLINHTGVMVIENAGEGSYDEVVSSVSYTMSNNLENLSLTGNSAINGTGNTGHNFLLGNSSTNILDGGIGNDALEDGGGGADTLIGGQGNDDYYINVTGITIIENAGEGSDYVCSLVSYTLSDNLESLLFWGSGLIKGTGNTLTNRIEGNSVANVLDGGAAGSDTLVGGTGNDTYVIDHTGVTITELIGEGMDLIQSNVNFTLGAFVENLTLTGINSINGFGNSLNNIIIGNSMDNFIYGGIDGKDTLRGGIGNDQYIIDRTGIVIKESLNEGNDIVNSSINYTLNANNVENLLLIGNAIIGQGNTLSNFITGNTENNIFYGGSAGNDIMAGFNGNDTYIIDHTGVTINENTGEGTSDFIQSSVSYTISAFVENMTLTGSSAINGYGNSLTNTITGNSKNNIIDAGTAGSDTLIGGAGNDTYIIDHASVVVTESASSGIDIIQSAVAYTLSTDVEKLTLTGSSAITGKGNASANYITGNSGNDTLIALTGNDTLAGGAGNDEYHFSAGDDLDVIALDGGGTNVVKILDVAKATIAVYVSTASNTLYLDYAADDTDILTIKNYSTAVSSIWDSSGSASLTTTQINAIIADIAAYNAQHAGVDTVQEVRSAAQTDITGWGGLTLMQKIAADWA